MRLLTKKVPLNFNIFQISCTHFGSRLCHENGIDDLFHMVNSEYDGIPAKHNYVLHHGDIIEGITTDDPRFFSVSTSRPQILQQVAYAVKRLKEIPSKQWVAILQGNHEDKHLKFGYLAYEVAKDVGATFGTSECKISYTRNRILNGQIPNPLFKQFAIHGAKQITSTADDPERAAVNMKLILKRQLKFKHGDCWLMTKGHTHKLVTLRPRKVLWLKDNGFKITQDYTKPEDVTGSRYIHPDNRWYGNVGAFYKVYGKEILDFDPTNTEKSVFSSYVARFEYDPVALGFIVTKVRNGVIIELEKVIV